jgi:transposase
VQVKYEMVRRVRVDGVSIVRAAAAFGYCRQSYYAVAAALDAGGPSALAGGKPGPKGPRKLVDPVMAQVERWLVAEPALKSGDLASRVKAEFGFTVHPRSVERALARRAAARAAKEAPQPG